MAAADDARRESESARQRLTVLAQELSRRTTGEELKARAHEKADELKHAMKDRAHEKAHDLKEAAVERTTRMRDRAGGNPKLLAAIGGLLGAQLGYFLARSGKLTSHRAQAGYGYGRDERFLGRREYEPTGRHSYDERTYVQGAMYAPTPTYGAYAAGTSGGAFEQPSARERASEAATSAKEAVTEKVEHAKAAVGEKVETVKAAVSEKLGAAKESAADTTEAIREKLPTTGEVKERAHDAYERAVNDYPWALAAGALAFGVLASLLVPETERERRAFSGVKERAREQLEKVGDTIEERISGGEEREAGFAQAGAGTSPLVSSTGEPLGQPGTFH